MMDRADTGFPTFEQALASRLPGEQIVLMDSQGAAEVYLELLADMAANVERLAYPNNAGMYARIRYSGRIQEDKLYVAGPAARAPEPVSIGQSDSAPHSAQEPS
jgi:hypothetical protein